LVWKARICGEQLYHHIYAWSNDRHPVFKEPKHYKKYLGLLRKYSAEYKIDIIAYALMEWHVHLFVYDDENSLSNFMLKQHGAYAQYFNRDTNRVGHVFGERFNNKIVVPNVYGTWLTRYIHRQPLEANLIKDPKDYPWTSYRVYIGLKKSDFVKTEIILEQFGRDIESHTQYEQFVLSEGGDDPIDWSKKSLVITDSKHMLRHVSRELGIEESTILNPHGRAERRKRYEAIKLLFKEYNYSKAQIAAALGLSRAAITIIIRNVN